MTRRPLTTDGSAASSHVAEVRPGARTVGAATVRTEPRNNNRCAVGPPAAPGAEGADSCGQTLSTRMEWSARNLSMSSTSDVKTVTSKPRSAVLTATAAKTASMAYLCPCSPAAFIMLRAREITLSSVCSTSIRDNAQSGHGSAQRHPHRDIATKGQFRAMQDSSWMRGTPRPPHPCEANTTR